MGLNKGGHIRTYGHHNFHDRSAFPSGVHSHHAFPMTTSLQRPPPTWPHTPRLAKKFAKGLKPTSAPEVRNASSLMSAGSQDARASTLAKVAPRKDELQRALPLTHSHLERKLHDSKYKEPQTSVQPQHTAAQRPGGESMHTYKPPPLQKGTGTSSEQSLGLLAA